MSKFLGAKNGKIKVISDTKFSNTELEIVELPKELEEVNTEELILNYHIKNAKVICKNQNKKASQMTVAFISNIFEACGLSTYFENLLHHLGPELLDYRVFAEINPEPKKTNLNIDVNKIVPCWKRGDQLLTLIQEIKKWDPDLIIINMEFGLFPNSRYWLSMMTQLSEYKIVTVMHSVFPNHDDKIIVEASMKNILVHSNDAKEVLLKKKGVNANVFVVPHGCYASNESGRLWNFYRSNATFMQVGFGFQYKAFEECIEAAKILKEKYPDVYCTILFSESPFAKLEHERYYEKLFDLIKDYGLENNIGIIRGFQSDTVIDAFLRTNKVAVFPYKTSPGHLVYGSSGAARLAMSKNIPVITSTIPHFSDLPTIKADTAIQIAAALDQLFSDYKKQNKQVELQNEFIKQNSWKITAEKYIEVIESNLS